MSSETEPSAAPAGLGRASAMLASGTIVSRILGFIRVVVLAAAIGQASSPAAKVRAKAAKSRKVPSKKKRNRK